jgi:glycosyltransferase involved in cell wall biosynthesis
MKNTIIIPVRKELPENLQRTVENLNKKKDAEDKILVVADGEQALPDLNARIVIPWELPRGCGQARHSGIIMSDSAEDDIVTLVDAHMDFPTGFSKVIKEKIKENEGIYYWKMQSIGYDWKPLSNLYYGADLRSRCLEPGNQAWAIACKWSKEKTVGERTGLMGACYSFSRKFYRKMGEPLKVLEAWGCDEEILSLACHFSGGRIEVLDGVVDHMYAAPHTRANLSTTEIIKIWGNRHATLEAMPWSESVKEDYIRWLRKTNLNWSVVQAEVETRREVIEEVKEVLRGKGHKLYKKVKENIKEMSEEELKENLERKKTLIIDDQKRNLFVKKENNIIEKIEIKKKAVIENRCPRCNAIGTLVKTPKVSIFGAQWRECKRCMHKCRLGV